jgi:hypothetical protein
MRTKLDPGPVTACWIAASHSPACDAGVVGPPPATMALAVVPTREGLFFVLAPREPSPGPCSAFHFVPFNPSADVPVLPLATCDIPFLGFFSFLGPPSLSSLPSLGPAPTPKSPRENAFLCVSS